MHHALWLLVGQQVLNPSTPIKPCVEQVVGPRLVTFGGLWMQGQPSSHEAPKIVAAHETPKATVAHDLPNSTIANETPKETCNSSVPFFSSLAKVENVQRID
jgi:hypothetical protein